MITDFIQIAADTIRKKKEQKQQESHYPSSASVKIDGKVIGKCLRAQHYAWENVPWSNPTEDKGTLRMSFGDALHGYLSESLKEAGLSITPEVPFKLEYPGLREPISGRVDGLIEEVDGTKTGLEFKFMFGRGGSDVAKNGPRKDWLLQTLIYMKLLRIRTWSIIAIEFPSMGRWQFDLHEDNIKYDFQGVIARWKELEESLLDHKVPERDFKQTDWQCNYCNWKDYCWK